MGFWNITRADVACRLSTHRKRPVVVSKLRNRLSFASVVFALRACSAEHEAEARLAGNTTATMSVSAMFGIHSDWHRSFTIGDGQTAESIDLFEDTGWCRGSHLYLHQ